MDELRKKHRQEQKDLQSRITQKKKSATKKTRKGVNDECAELERHLKERQQDELSALGGDSGKADLVDEESSETVEDSSQKNFGEVEQIFQDMSISKDTLGSNGHVKKPNRQKARLARRAAEQEATVEQAHKEAADLPNLREKEIASMRDAYVSRGLVEHEIRSDGHCLYAAIADQLHCSSIDIADSMEIESPETKPAPYKLVRYRAAKYISDNPDDFAPFLEEPLQDYVKTITETGEWGGHLEILALAKAYGVNVNVMQGNGKVEKIECGLEDGHSELWLAYYRHSFGLGEHYNSLRRGP